MARIRMVTRTVTLTLATALVCDLENNILVPEVLRIGGYFTDADDKAFQKALKAAYPDKLVAKVVQFEYEETLYGMPEAEFLKYAKVLPPRNGNADADAEEEE